MVGEFGARNSDTRSRFYLGKWYVISIWTFVVKNLLISLDHQKSVANCGRRRGRKYLVRVRIYMQYNKSQMKPKQLKTEIKSNMETFLNLFPSNYIDIKMIQWKRVKQFLYSLPTFIIMIIITSTSPFVQLNSHQCSVFSFWCHGIFL